MSELSVCARESYPEVVPSGSPAGYLDLVEEHECVSLAFADSARFGLKGEERTDDTPPRDRIFKGHHDRLDSPVTPRDLVFFFFFLLHVFLYLFLFAFSNARAPSFRRDLLIRSFALTFTSVFQRERSRNCLFSGIPGTSWSQPRHREIESSGFSPLS